MSTSPPKPVLLDDKELLTAVTSPRTRLFQVLTRVSAFAPLIVVCAVFPAFQLLARPVPNDDASLWGLRSLAVASAETLDDLLKPGLNGPGQPLLFQPPLAAWFNALFIRLTSHSREWAASSISALAIGLAIWLMTRFAKRIGGANAALVSAVLMCSHPQILGLTIIPSNGAVGILLMLAAVFGFQRHLEGHAVRVSASLAVTGIVWGLSLLAVGPVAFMIPLLFVIHSLNQKPGSEPEFMQRPFQFQLLQSRTILRATLLIVGLGLVVGCWWNLVMFASYGTQFTGSWWTGLPPEFATNGNSEWHCDLRAVFQPTWRESLLQNSLILGWLIVGLERSWHAWQRPTSELARRRFQLMLLWWCIAFAGRLTAELCRTSYPMNTQVWDLALLSPTILLSAVGIGTFIERDVSRRGEFCLFLLLVTLTAARLSMSWLTGLGCGAVAATFLLCGPLVMPTMGRTVFGWTEEGWRQLMQLAVYASLIACLVFGLRQPSLRTDEQAQLMDLRERLKSLPEVRRVSVIAPEDPIPVTLRYMLRHRWPNADLIVTEDWDDGLTKAMKDEATSPASRFLVLEWTRRDIRLTADTDPAWQISSGGSSLRFRSRRLSMILIQPRS